MSAGLNRLPTPDVKSRFRLVVRCKCGALGHAFFMVDAWKRPYWAIPQGVALFLWAERVAMPPPSA